MSNPTARLGNGTFCRVHSPRVSADVYTLNAVLEGDEHQVDKLLELIRQGPNVAQVREVKVSEIEKAGHKSFEVR